MLDMDEICIPPTGKGVPIPTFANIYSVTNESKIDNLNNGETAIHTPHTLILVTKFLGQDCSKEIIQHEEISNNILLKVVAKMKEFDTNIQGVEPSYIHKATDKSKDLVKWLYLSASNNLIISPLSTAQVKNIVIQKIFEDMTDNCISEKVRSVITQVTPHQSAIDLNNILNKPLEMIATSNLSQHETLRHILNLKNTNVDKSSRSFTKIPAKYQNMILVASSSGEFFKCSSLLNNSILLNSLLEA